MGDYILLMHDDAAKTSQSDLGAAWGQYIETLKLSGKFQGGSALGSGQCYRRSGVTSEVTAHIVGYILVQADDIDDASQFLKGNPVFEAGGNVEIRELPRD